VVVAWIHVWDIDAAPCDLGAPIVCARIVVVAQQDRPTLALPILAVVVHGTGVPVVARCVVMKVVGAPDLGQAPVKGARVVVVARDLLAHADACKAVVSLGACVVVIAQALVQRLMNAGLTVAGVGCARVFVVAGGVTHACPRGTDI